MSALTVLSAWSCSDPAGKLDLDLGQQEEVDSGITIRSQCRDDLDCADEDPCTTDLCNAEGKCENVLDSGASCDDDNPCTTGDKCGEDGKCTGGESVFCDDANPCTADSCNQTQGCVFEPVEVADVDCDGTPCTMEDMCQQGACVPGPLVECEDPAPGDCSYPTCNPKTGACDSIQQHVEGHPCADGNPCTDDDACDALGACQPGTPHLCASQHPCKSAWCNDQAKEGTNPCMSDFLPEQTPCDDGSKCTDADKCTLGAGGQLQCTGTPLVCDDGNVCTLDTCAEETGCSFSPKSDGTACGGVEKCGGQGKCQGGICQWSQGQGCDDGVACTTDTCLADGSCTNEPQDSACDDWDGCNGPETCHPTQGCQPGVPMVCNDGIVCTLDQCSNGKCSFPTDPAVCNDGNPCTNDSCVPPAGCSSTFNSAACDDGDPCTVGDLCAAGSCTGGPANNCDDANACTQDSCDPQKGCVHVPLGPECGACTPYAVEPCYDGPDGTAGKGACQKGFKQCLATGNGWSPCYGQTLPLGDDICDNGLDDDCDGTEADESCGAAPGGGVWADYDHGHDDTGNGSFNNPYQTMAKAVASNSKLVMLKADADGTIYPEEVHVGAVVSGFTVKGWGPTRPILQGRLDLVHCYDCVFENIEFRYPKPGQFANDIGGAVDTVHNYRNTFRKVKLSAPDGLPSGYSLARCHHGYDNLWVDIEIDDVVLLPKDGSSSHTLLNWQDHGSGSQFVRVKMGSKISVSGGLPSQIGITFISVGGYCSTWPKGVSGIRNCVAGNLDLQGLSTGSSSFTAFNYWCYFPTEAASGLTVANNTVAHVTAGNVTAFTSSQAFDFEVEVTSNVFGPFTGSSTVGVSSGNPIQVRYTDIWGVLTAYSGQVSAGVGNISKDPIYKSPQIGDFHLVPGSPCINTGDPQFPDLDGTAADMGAFGGPYAAW